MTTIICDRKMMLSFLRDQLEQDDRLVFLFHLDECPNCWDTVYNATKATHPHFYKRPPRKTTEFSEKEIRSLEGNTDRTEDETEKIFEVA